MNQQKLKYTKYDLFLLLLTGLLAGTLAGILIIMLLVKKIDSIATLLVGILPLLVGVVMVIYQMERQHKDNYLLQISNHKEELKLKVYKEISEYVGCAMQSYEENQILINSLMRQYHNCLICQDDNRNPSPKIYTKDTELSDAHSRMLRSLAQLMNKLAEYEIVDKNIEIFRTALASAFQLILDAYLEFQRHIFAYLPSDVPKERLEQLGVNIKHAKSPSQQDIKEIEHSFNSYTAANLEGYCFVSDLSREAQNVLLGNLFNNQVPPRKPSDSRYVVVTTKPEDVERLKVYFTEKDDDGLTQHQKDFRTRTESAS
jgi:xanthosine utilization system XapX-like protein